MLDHGAERVDDVCVGLVGKSGDEAEIMLADLEAAANTGPQELVAFLSEQTRRSEAAVQKLLENGRALIQGDKPDTRRLLNTACDNDITLAARVAPFNYVLRTDLRGLPVIFRPGALVVRQMRTRSDFGAEYTPRELAETMARRTLEPLVYSPGPQDGVDASKWILRNSKDLLNLKLCDPAAGSGAFLVSACRFLGDRVVEAWISEGPPSASVDREALTLVARRIVADQCIYGVDRDSMAVEMAKLSLWLITMSRDRPFNFLDHAIQEGDSLLGITSLKQLEFLHIDPEAGREAHSRTLDDITALVRPAVTKALELYRMMKSIPSESVRDGDEKRRLCEAAEKYLCRLCVVADGLIGTAVDVATESRPLRDAAFQGYASIAAAVLREALNAADANISRNALSRLRSRNEQILNAGRPDKAPLRVPLHWPLAFPEVFAGPDGGFDAILGNPPFLGNKYWKGAYGEALQRTVHVVLGMAPGKIDLSVAFHRRVVPLLRSGGNYGLLGKTNIAEGSALKVGLDEIVREGDIFFSRKSMPWPGAAAVFVAIVCFHKAVWNGEREANGIKCFRIGPRLEPEVLDAWQPKVLVGGLFSFAGVDNSKGLAFLIGSESEWFLPLTNEPRSLLRPYITGDDLTTYALNGVGRWALDIEDRSLDEIERHWPLAYRFLMNVVRPTRTPEALRSYPGLLERWWQFWNHRAIPMKRLRARDTFIAYSKNTKYPICMVAPSHWIYTNKVLLIEAERDDALSVCLSAFFRRWLEQHSGRIEERLSLSVSEAVVKYPMPKRQVAESGIVAAARFHTKAVDWAHEHMCGLTDVMNAINSADNVEPEILEMRALLPQIDTGVAEAYGFNDLELIYAFLETPSGIRWTLKDSTREGILSRLVRLNREYYEKQASDPRSPSIRTSTKTSTRVRVLQPYQVQAELIDDNG